MNPWDQQPGESRAAWKERTFAFHYGMGANRLRDMFERHGRMPQPGDTFTYTVPDGFADSFTPSAEHQYRGRDDGYRYDRAYFGRQWFADEGETRTERALNTIEDWDELGVELPELILVPGPNGEGVFVITRME